MRSKQTTNICHRNITRQPPWENSRGCGYTSIMCIRVGCVRLGGRHWKGFFPFSTFEQEWEVGMTKLYTQHTHTRTIYSTSITSRWSSRSVNKYRVNNSCPVFVWLWQIRRNRRLTKRIFFIFFPYLGSVHWMLRRCDAVDNFSIQHWIGIIVGHTLWSLIGCRGIPWKNQNKTRKTKELGGIGKKK